MPPDKKLPAEMVRAVYRGWGKRALLGSKAYQTGLAELTAMGMAGHGDQVKQVLAELRTRGAG
jgi:hypothetical protein